jgi:Rhs element Vgr protein
MSVVTPTILSDGKQIPPEYELLSIDVVKELNRIPSAQIVLIDGDLVRRKFLISDTDFFKPGRQVDIRLSYEGARGGPTTVFKGVVVAQRVEAAARGTLLSVELRDAAVALTMVRRSAVYCDRADHAIIGAILSQAKVKQGKIDSTSVKHPQLVQYACTDWDFILARAEANGLLVCADDGVVSARSISPPGPAKHTFKIGIDTIYEFELEADAAGQLESLKSVAWDLKQQRPTRMQPAASFRLSQGNLTGKELPNALKLAEPILTNPVPLDPKELKAWADATLARSRLSLLRGRIGGPGMSDVRLFDSIDVSGIGKRFDGKTIVTGIRHRVGEDGWRTDVQFGLAAERFAERRDLIDLPAGGLLPGVNGLQIGVVAGFKQDPDGELRVRVVLPALGEKSGEIWARLAAPDAGRERGFFFRPETGDEVVVGFLNDDPRQAVILGSLFGSKNRSPGSFGEPKEENKLKGIVTRQGTTISFNDDEKPSVFIQTPAKNKILLDDDRQTITLEDQHGNTVTLSKDGIVLKSAKDITLDASGSVTIKGQKVDVK